MARVVPCGLNATEETESPGPVVNGVPMGLRVATSHNHTVPLRRSELPAASVVPPGLNATAVIWPPWPVRGLPMGWRVATFHNRTLPSLLPVARIAPSGLNATELTPLWPLRRGLPMGWRV